MPLRRTLLLQQMGIEQWILRRPQALKGAAAIAVGEAVKLLIISDDEHLPTALLHDIYRALGIQYENSLILNSEQAARLQLNKPLAVWFIGQNSALSAHQLAALGNNNTLVSAESWQQLKQATAKRRLWQQLQQFQLRDDGL
ncbi:DNA polymerase III subunit psi [Pasteurella testudinis]|uniref:DNA polymerase III subunit psi n=1 Tax=Pasteurella testudinis TaxID=761 RepID=UPI004059B4D3